MIVEINSASNFLAHLLKINPNGLSEPQLQLFKNSLEEVLRLRYQEHWFPDRPTRGSGYRCLRINGNMDPVIAQAGDAIGLPPPYLHSLFPTELTLWIDPAEVSYRIGENGSICVLYEHNTCPSPGPDLLNLEKNEDQPSNNASGCKDSLRELYITTQNTRQMAQYVSS